MNIIVRSLLIYLSIFFTGCVFFHRTYVPSTMNLHKTIYIDRNLSDYESMSVINAIKNWECSTNEMVKFNIIQHASYNDIANISDPFDAVIITNVPNNDPDIMESNRIQVALGTHAVGKNVYAPNGIEEIKIVESLIDMEEYTALVEHEIGHVLGLQHVGTHDYAIMTPCLRYGAEHITQEDIKQFCDIYQCDARDFHACK